MRERNQYLRLGGKIEDCVRQAVVPVHPAASAFASLGRARAPTTVGSAPTLVGRPLYALGTYLVLEPLSESQLLRGGVNVRQ